MSARLRVVVIVESCFGTTAQVAAVLAEELASAGATVETTTAERAAGRVCADLVLVGAPTHLRGLPTAASRGKASERGGSAPSSGVREWVERVKTVEGRVFTFSTTRGTFWAGSAGKAAVRALRRRRVRARHGLDIVVTGTSGPLGDGEVERVRAWARKLAASAPAQSRRT